MNHGSVSWSGFVLVLLAGCQTTGSLRSASVEHVTQGHGSGPRILCVVAHPDDETAFAATVYKATVSLEAACDMFVITNGEGGFKYSTLSEPLYGLELTDETVGRRHLPTIRRQEFLAGCRILGVRDALFLDQTDHRYTTDVDEVLGEEVEVWDLGLVRERLARVLHAGDYSFVFVLLPAKGTHAHHQAATILALEAVSALPSTKRPAVLAARPTSRGDPGGLPDLVTAHPVATIDETVGPFRFDRTTPFGHRGRLNYQIVVNWVIAEHKSQGTMQLAMNGADFEDFHWFAINDPEMAAEAADLFEALAQPYFESREYGSSAGTNAAATP